jgi:hypothetical protein
VINWIRLRATQSVWCALQGAEDSSGVTACGGSIAVSDALQFDVHAAPPHDDRCSRCVRELAHGFAATVARACAADAGMAEQLAADFGVALPTVARWANGTARPHPRMQRQILDAIARTGVVAVDLTEAGA